MLSKKLTIFTIKKIISEFPDTYTRRIRMKGNEELVEAINKYLPKVINTDKYDFKTKIYWLIKNITVFPKCIVCGKELSDKNIKNIFIGYHQCCSQLCAKNSKQRKERYKLTCIKHFGVENASQSDSIKDKKKNTTLQNYGVDNPAKAFEVLKRMQNTMFKNHGVKFALQNKDIKDKLYKTMFERYGTNHALQNNELNRKAQDTTMKHYGVRYPMLSREIRIKAQQKYIYNRIGFDSKPELVLYIYLKDNDMLFEYQPNISYMYELNGKHFEYFPDFMIKGLIYEIKGRHFFKEDGTMQNPFCHSQDEIYEAKHQCMLKNNVKIILDDDQMILNAEEYVNMKYGKNYLEQFKRIKK